MIEDIEIAYLGVTIKVSHSFYKPASTIPGRIRYTCHLPTGEVTVEQQLNEDDSFYWAQVPGGRTPLAEELGYAIENFQTDDDVDD